MALEDLQLPEISPLGSPVGRFDESPLADTKMGDMTQVDIFAGEDIGGLENFPDTPEPQQIPTEIDGKPVHSHGFHNATEDQHQNTYGTGQTTSLSQNDVYGNIPE